MGDSLSNNLVERLIEKAFEGMGAEEKMAFVQKLFAELDSASQQEFLLKLAREATDKKTPREDGGSRRIAGPPFMRQILEEGSMGFAPWEMCARIMSSFAAAPHADAIKMGEPAQLFRALSDETRLKVVKLLSQKEMCVEDLMEALGLAQPTVSHHLQVLKAAGLVRGEKRGRNVYYALAQPLAEK